MLQVRCAFRHECACARTPSRARTDARTHGILAFVYVEQLGNGWPWMKATPSSAKTKTFVLQGRCSRENCKYLHPPTHLKTQLEINGRNNLIQQKTAAAMLAQQMQFMFPGTPLHPVVSTSHLMKGLVIKVLVQAVPRWPKTASPLLCLWLQLKQIALKLNGCWK